MTKKDKKEKVIIISGIGPTGDLYDRLGKFYTVAVYDHAHAQRLSAERAGIGIACPLAGAGEPMFNKARNDVAMAANNVLGLSSRFSLDGVTPTDLTKTDDWLPGLFMGFGMDLAVNLRALDAYAETVDVKAVVVHEDVTPKYRALALWGKAQGVPTIHIPHNNSYIQTRPDIHDQSLCDWIFAASPYMRDWYKKRGFDPERILLTGFPCWDGWADPVSRPTQVSKHQARSTFLLDQEKPVITLCTGWPQRTNFVDDHAMTKAATHLLLDRAREEDWQIIWKMHPGDAQGKEQEYVELCASYRIQAAVTRGHLAYALRAADVVISTGPSNVLVEAAICDRPPAYFPLRGYGFPKAPPPWVIDPREDGWHAKLGELVADQSEWKAKRARFVKRYAHHVDGKASKRVVRRIHRIVKEAQR